MENKYNMIAFDLGGVLAYQDLSVLSSEELILLKTFIRRNNIKNSNKQELELLRYAKTKILDIYLKIYKLNVQTIPLLEKLSEFKVSTSIWTNNIKEIEVWLETVGLYKYIPYERVINSIYLGVDKPNINYYKKALEILGYCSNDILFLDDSENNLLGAKKCGIATRKYNIEENLYDAVLEELGGKKL